MEKRGHAVDQHDGMIVCLIFFLMTIDTTHHTYNTPVA